MKEESEKERKRRLKKAAREAQREAEVRSCPVEMAKLGELVEAVRRLAYEEYDSAQLPPGRSLCDRTHRFTRSYLDVRGVNDPEPVIAFLRSKGGYCDCGVAVKVGSWLGWNTRETRH
ncbi:MAG TPA: DUF2695 domain-containing protein [Hyphomicrobiaceae bacterium]|nr:DUF2695 domain-containing protein [Hyphomicrobiaceae bacterium]